MKLARAQRSTRKLNKAAPIDVAARFIGYLDEREPVVYCYTLFLAGLGLRPGEACAVQAGDLDRERGLIAIRRKKDPRASGAQDGAVPAPGPGAARRPGGVRSAARGPLRFGRGSPGGRDRPRR